MHVQKKKKLCFDSVEVQKQVCKQLLNLFSCNQMIKKYIYMQEILI